MFTPLETNEPPLPFHMVLLKALLLTNYVMGCLLNGLLATHVLILIMTWMGWTARFLMRDVFEMTLALLYAGAHYFIVDAYGPDNEWVQVLIIWALFLVHVGISFVMLWIADRRIEAERKWIMANLVPGPHIAREGAMQEIGEMFEDMEDSEEEDGDGDT